MGNGITEDEVEAVLHGRGEDLPAARNSRMKLGQTPAGRYLQVIYVPDEIPESVFVITAYELQGKAKKAYRRRQREEILMDGQKLPCGWDEERVHQVLDHYEPQSEDEQAGEIEAAHQTEGMTLMAVPTALVPEVRALLAEKQGR